MAKLRSVKVISLLIILLVGFAAASTANAAIKFWKNSVTSGTWNTSNNWSAVLAAGGDNGGVPVAGEPVRIVHTNGAAHLVTLNATTPTLGPLAIDLTGPGATTNTLSITSNINLTAASINVGGHNGTTVTNGRGAIVQSAGTVTSTSGLDIAVGNGAGSIGAYTLSGTGALNVPQSLYVGLNGTGTFHHSAGTNTVLEGTIGALDIGTFAGASGTYNLSGTGQLISNKSVYVGDQGTGIFNHTGGTVTIHGDDDLYLGWAASGNGTYTLSGAATLTVGDDLFVGFNGAGTLNVQGGLAHVGDTLRISASDTLNLSGGTLRLANLVLFGSGTINYTGGNVQLPYLESRAVGGDPTIAAFFGSSPVVPTGKGLIFETAGAHNNVHNSVSVSGGLISTQGELIIGDQNVGGNLTVSNGGTVNVRLDTNVGFSQISTLNVTGAGSTYTANRLYVDQYGTVTVQNGAMLSTGDYLRIWSGGVLNLTGGTVRLNDYLRQSGGQFNFNFGTIQLAGDRMLGDDALVAEFFGAGPLTIPMFKGLTVEGTATIEPSLPVTLAGNLSAGTLLMTPGSRLTTTAGSVATAAVLALPGSTIDATSASLTIGDPTKVNGFYSNGTMAVGERSVVLRDANDAVFDSAALVTLGSGASPGEVIADNGLTLDFGANITGYGTVSTPNSIAKPLINNGHITGSNTSQRISLPGYVKGVGTLENVNVTGTLAPGFSPAVLNVGNLGFADTSTLVMEIGGTLPGSQHDQIVSSGQLGFDGVLQVSLINGFTPIAGQSFNMFDWASRTGMFDSVVLPMLSGLTWNTSQLYTTGVLSVAASAVLAGDFNADGAVDAADYVTWRKGLGAPYTQTHYNAWRANFGQTSGGGTGADRATVPEPTALALVLLVATGWFFPTRGKRGQIRG
jgi:T5SS/PEP-CTERM-associated repeat protein